ncbi:MAG: hypothetical protein H5U23_17425 [Phenylobacterium sp.]|nr:hypothetical protein [Phenylobacterium sp.]
MKLYRQFLDYKYFYGIDRPTIICEGPTDRVYLRAAIRHHVDDFPGLAFRDEKSVKLVPRILGASATTDRVLGLGGGSGDLSNLICRYKKDAATYTFRKPAAPVIIICDNDDGAKKIFSSIRSTSRHPIVDGSQTYYHVFGNLYVAPLPKILGQPTDIERLLSDRLTTGTYNGKTFHRGGEGFDRAQHFGKIKLSEFVSRLSTAKDDFSMFENVLQAVVEIQEDYVKNGWR